MTTRGQCWTFLGLSIALAGCTGEVTAVTNAPAPAASHQDAPAAQPSCAGGLCIAHDVRAKLDAIQAAAAICVPVTPDEATPTADTSGLRIADIAFAQPGEGSELDGIPSPDAAHRVLRVTLANVSPHGSYAYPGVILAAGAADVSPKDGDWRYGMLPCSQTVASFLVPASSGHDIALEADAASSFGEQILDRVAFQLQ